MRHVSALFLFALSLAGVADARELFVSVAGDDSSDGRSWRRAWRTPERAFSELRAGDTLTFGDGRYSWGGELRLQGRRDAPIVIQARRKGRTVLDGGGRITNWQRAPGLRHVWWAAVPGEKPVLLCSEADTRQVLRQSPDPGDCERRLGCWAFDPATRKLYLRTSTGLAPDRHVIEISHEPWGLLIRGGSDPKDAPKHIVVRGLVLKNYANAGLRANYAEHLLIEDCQVLQSGYGLELWYSSRTTVRRCETWANYFQRHTEAAAIMFHGTSRNSLATDNYVHDSRQDGIRAYGGEGSEGTRFVRNLVVNTRAPMYFKGGGVLGIPDKNVVVGGEHFGRTVANPPAGGANTVVGVVGLLKTSARDLIVPPGEQARARFADPAYHDYRLQSDSPYRARASGSESIGAFPYEAVVFYVGPEGSDANAGTSAREQWRTLSRAARELAPGQSLYLMPGIYRESLTLERGGTRDAPITIRAYGRGQVVIEPEAATGILLENAPHVQIEGIEVRSASGTAIALRDSPDSVLRRTIVRSSDIGIAATRSPRGLADHVLLSGNRSVGLQLGADSSDWQVTNSAFARNREVQVRVGKGSQPEVYLESNAYDVPPGGQLGAWGADPAADLAAWQALSGEDAGSVEGRIEFPDAEHGDFDVAPGSLLAGAGWLAASIGPGRLRPEASPPSFENLKVDWVGARAAVLTWETPRRESRTLAWYGKDPSLSQKVTGVDGTLHSVTLADLEPETTYYVRVGTDGRHPALPPALPKQDPREIRDYQEIAAPLEALEQSGVSGGISPLLEFRTRRTSPPRRTLYVSKSGNDSASGRDLTQAWKSLRKAASEARPGDEVIIEPGVYAEVLVPLAGGATPERRTLYRSASWQPVVIAGSGRLQDFGLRLRGHKHMSFQGFHFRGQHGPDSGQVLLEGMNDDIRLRYCFFDGRDNWTAGIRTRYNSTNRASVEDSAFLQNWRAIVWYFGTINVNHSVFDVSIFSDIYLLRRATALRVENSVSTSANARNSHAFGHLIVAEDHEHIHSNFNAFYFQPYDESRLLFRLGAWPYRSGVEIYRGADGLERWQQRTRNGGDTRIIESPGFAGSDTGGSGAGSPPGWKREWLDDYRLLPGGVLSGAARGGRDIGIRFPLSSSVDRDGREARPNPGLAD